MAEGNLHYYGRPLKRNPIQSSNITIPSALQTYEKESAAGNVQAAAHFVLTATGCFHFCTYCHRMLPVNRGGLVVSH